MCCISQKVFLEMLKRVAVYIKVSFKAFFIGMLGNEGNFKDLREYVIRIWAK